MSDPKHPLKVVITIEKGMLTGIWLDKKPQQNITFLVADYDVQDEEDEDFFGTPRHVAEETAWVDSPKVRQILNKKRKET